MRPFHFIILAPFLVFAAVTPAHSQVRVGILVQELERSQSQAIKGLGEGLKRLGYREKQNLFFEMRNVKSNRAALQSAANDLLARKVTVIFTTGTSATRAASSATKETPIVFVYGGDPVTARLVQSPEERPKNLTGVAAYASRTTEKRLGLLKQILPNLTKILVFYDAANPYSHGNFIATKAAAMKFGMQAEAFPIKSSDELKTTLGSLRPEPGAAIFQIADDLFENDFEFVFETTRAKKLPTMFNEEMWAIRGALAAYGPNYLEMGRLAAPLVDKIIKGQKPESLALERANKFDLILNYRTARFIDVSFSPEILKSADKVIR